MSMETRALGDAIRAARMKKGLTQDALSELLDITPTHLKNIEGSRRKPSVPLLFQMMELLEPDLTEEELAVYKRGRNAHSPTMAKHATMADYRRATGFEALMGYLYLKEDYSRIVELVRKGIPEENL